MKRIASGVFYHVVFADQFYGTLAGVERVGIEVCAGRSASTTKPTVCLHTAAHLPTGRNASIHERRQAEVSELRSRHYGCFNPPHLVGDFGQF